MEIDSLRGNAPAQTWECDMGMEGAKCVVPVKTSPPGAFRLPGVEGGPTLAGPVSRSPETGRGGGRPVSCPPPDQPPRGVRSWVSASASVTSVPSTRTQSYVAAPTTSVSRATLKRFASQTTSRPKSGTRDKSHDDWLELAATKARQGRVNLSRFHFFP